MLYTHFTKEEMDQIVDILNRHSIKHEIEINEDLIEEQNERISRLRYERYVTGATQIGRLFYGVRIEDEVFEKIPSSVKQELAKFNIMPQLSEVLFHAETEKIMPIKTVEKAGFWEKLVSYLVIPVIIYLLLDWIDRFITPIWP